MTELAILVNPRARAVRTDPGLPARLAELSRGIGEVHVTTEVALPALVHELGTRGVSTIALCGGDGTGQTVLTALVRDRERTGRSLPRIALLRGGTINTIAGNLSAYGTPESLLAALCGRLRAGAHLPTQRQDILRVEDQCGFLFAAALGARFLELYYERPHPTAGRAMELAARVSLSALLGGALARRLFRPTAITAIVDDASPVFIREARLVVASTVADVGVGMRIAPRARALPGRFQLIVSGLSAFEMARQLPAVRAGRALEGSPHLDVLAAHARLVLSSAEPYTLDGELYRSSAIDLRAAGAVDIVRG